MIGIKSELIIFVIAVLSGIAVRLVYACISCFRQIVNHNFIIMGIEDFIFWFCTAIYLFVQMFHTSDGSIRWYFILGIVIGGALCSFFIRKAKKMYKKLYAKKRKKSPKGIEKSSERR